MTNKSDSGRRYWVENDSLILEGGEWHEDEVARLQKDLKVTGVTLLRGCLLIGSRPLLTTIKLKRDNGR